MTGNKQIPLLILLILTVGFTAVFVPTAPSQDIHVLIVSDDGNPRTGKGHSIDKDRIEGLVYTAVKPVIEKAKPGATIKVDQLLSSDRTLTIENIFGWFRNLNPGPDDVVFVYYSGPGGADEENPKRRYLNIGALKLYREGIATIMEVMPCRLKIFITDTYNNRSFIGTQPPIIGHPHDDHLDDLFLEHEGFLNLTSASPGQLSISDRDGGHFTYSLMEGMFPFEMRDVDRNPEDSFVSWEEVFELSKEYTHEYYRISERAFPENLKTQLKQRNQTTQIPEVLSEFPKRIRISETK